jgi:hypothetical protein
MIAVSSRFSCRSGLHLCRLVWNRPPKSSTSSSKAARFTTGLAKGRLVDVAIRGDRIAGIGNALNQADRDRRKGCAVAPGFINMLSWSTDSLIEDGRSQGEIRESHHGNHGRRLVHGPG